MNANMKGGTFFSTSIFTTNLRETICVHSASHTPESDFRVSTFLVEHYDLRGEILDSFRKY